MAKQTVIPRYRGFNLDYMLIDFNDSRPAQRERLAKYNIDFINSELEMIADLGFNFVRFPINYKNMIGNYDEFWKGEDPVLDEKHMLLFDTSVERAIELGLYVEFALHTAPGYSVLAALTSPEPHILWESEFAQDRFTVLWKKISERYKSISAKNMSYNLVNEPPSVQRGLTPELYARIMSDAIAAIRKNKDDKIIFADGIRWGRVGVPELCGIDGVAQSCRAYDPDCLTHCGFGRKEDLTLKWPGIEYYDPFSGRDKSEGTFWDYNLLNKEFGKWAEMAEKFNIGVHCGEGGFCSTTPYEQGIRWLRDVIEILNGYNIGFALWGLSSIFGMVDVQRKGAQYFEHKGHMIDKQIFKIMKTGI